MNMNSIRRSITFLAYFWHFLVDLIVIFYIQFQYKNLGIQRKIEIIRWFKIFQGMPLIPTMDHSSDCELVGNKKKIRVERRFRCRSMVNTKPTPTAISIGIWYCNHKRATFWVKSQKFYSIMEENLEKLRFDAFYSIKEQMA